MTITDQIISLLSHKSVWVAAGICSTILLGYYIFAAYVNSLDCPNETSTTAYKRKYKFLTFLAKELKMAAKEAHIPVADKTVTTLTTEDVKSMTDKTDG
jgi:hypothetical protein